jgi:hypothetical protein
LRKGLWCVPHECPNQIPHIIHWSFIEHLLFAKH